MNEPESIREQESRLRQMAQDDGDTWDLSDNDRAACRSGADAIRRLRGMHDGECESELTSHGYTPCRCPERFASLQAEAMPQIEPGDVVRFANGPGQRIGVMDALLLNGLASKDHIDMIERPYGTQFWRRGSR